ncbi:MAG: glycosyltransferase family 2 protein [Candidatus Acidiferrales bacterium]
MLSLPGLSISVVIPTKSRAADLEKAVESLLAQTRLPDELVLVDQSPERSFTNPTSLPLRYIHDPSLTGLTAARNAGMKMAKGDVWLFLDDDVILEPAFIEKILAAYRPGVTGVSGIITNYERPRAAHLLWESIFARGPFADDRQSVYWNAEALKSSAPIRVRYLGGGLMSFRAEVVRHLRFDTGLTGACPGEDIEFCAQLPREHILLITPSARLVHKRSPHGRADKHWLSLHAQVSSYMRERHWKRGLFNNVCYLWLNIGYLAAATLSAFRRMSSEPWHAWRQGIETGAAIGNGTYIK